MRHTTNPWTALENRQRYKLHQAIKKEFNYSPGKRTIYIEAKENEGIPCSAKAADALLKLRNIFGYTLQAIIGGIRIGATVRVGWEWKTGVDKKYRLDAVEGKKATITPLNGRWRKPRQHNIKNIFEV